MRTITSVGNGGRPPLGEIIRGATRSMVSASAEKSTYLSMLPGIRSLAAAMHLEIHRVYIEMTNYILINFVN